MTTPTVTTVDAGPQAVSRRITVNAPAAEILALVANPHRHPELDGSGTVRDAPVTGPDRLSKDATFKVGIKQFGVPYSITSTVTAFTCDRLVEWQHPLGHRWRWELAATSPGVTEVTETFADDTAKSPKILEILGMTKKNANGISATLQALAARFA